MNGKQKGYLGGAIASCVICIIFILLELPGVSIPFCLTMLVLYVLFFTTPNDYNYDTPKKK
jgi:hypothetical protein